MVGSLRSPFGGTLYVGIYVTADVGGRRRRLSQVSYRVRRMIAQTQGNVKGLGWGDLDHNGWGWPLRRLTDAQNENFVSQYSYYNMTP